MNLSKLRQASFKGVPFLVDNISTSGGRKTATHEYLNEKRRFVEDLGGLHKTFTVSAIIASPNYEFKRDLLILALETPGLAPFVHPTLGIFNVVLKTYTLSEDLSEVGVAKFDITFEQSDLPIFPQSTGNTISEMINKVDEFFDKLEDDIGLKFELIYSNFANFVDAGGKIDRIVSDINSATTESGSNYNENYNGFVSDLGEFEGNKVKNLNDPTSLATDLVSIGKQYGDIGNTAQVNYDLNKKIFDFGDDDIPFTANTVILQERDKNRKILNFSIKSLSLVNAYLNGIQLPFLTVDDLKTVESELDAQYEALLSQSDENDEALSIVKDIRLIAQDNFRTQQLNLFKINEINTKLTTARVLTYQYYGSLDNLNNIVDLNEFLNPYFVQGTVKVLEK